MRRLTCENKAVLEKYNIKALALLQFYEIDKKLDRIEEDQENIDELRRIKNLNAINAQVTSLLLHAKGMQKVKNRRGQFLARIK